jgi:hypothetical protein
MFFVLSKTVGLIFLPSNFVGLLGVVGTGMLFTRLASMGRSLVVASFGLFVLTGVLPLGNALLYVLENRFPPWTATVVACQLDTLATPI